MHNGEFKHKTLSYLNGDTLFDHKDPLTGERLLFARSYYDYDEDGKKVIEWLEVWDKIYLTRFKKSVGKSVYQKILETFGIDGYSTCI